MMFEFRISDFGF